MEQSFEYRPGTSGSEQVIYSFRSHPDGGHPAAGLLNAKGTLYGTTLEGGNNRHGTVFKVTPSGTESVLYSFAGGAGDGAYPQSALAEVNGTLYGTTGAGGGTGCFNSLGCGTVYAIAPSGTETVLHIFGGSGDGAEPYADVGLLNLNGTLYGTTYIGGAYGDGTVFSITTTGTESVLYSFKGGRDGAFPLGGLIAVNGTLYGTTEGGGVKGCDFHAGCGTVFKMSTSGAETVLYRFKYNGTDGEYPYEGSLVNLKSTLYGTTFYGGTYGFGAAFGVTTAGHEHVLHSFDGNDGEQPRAGLVALSGVLYGTTSSFLFSVTTAGKETALHEFTGPPDGAAPEGDLIVVKGRLYGTTVGGGTHGKRGRGTVYSLTP